MIVLLVDCVTQTKRELSRTETSTDEEIIVDVNRQTTNGNQFNTKANRSNAMMMSQSIRIIFVKIGRFHLFLPQLSRSLISRCALRSNEMKQIQNWTSITLRYISRVHPRSVSAQMKFRFDHDKVGNRFSIATERIESEIDQCRNESGLLFVARNNRTKTQKCARNRKKVASVRSQKQTNLIIEIIYELMKRMASPDQDQMNSPFHLSSLARILKSN